MCAGPSQDRCPLSFDVDIVMMRGRTEDLKKMTRRIPWQLRHCFAVNTVKRSISYDMDDDRA